MFKFDQFLTSGHHFSKHENLEKFRFALFNTILIIAAFFVFLNLIAEQNGFISFTPVYKIILFTYGLLNLFLIYLLRKKRSYYLGSVVTILLYATFVFFAALVTAPNDEFRLIWFFLVEFAAFVLMGKRFGLVLMFVILSGVFLAESKFDLGFTRLAMFTFFNSFIIFTAFAYIYLKKIEKDAEEFKRLNHQLQLKVSEEVQQRKAQEQMLLQQCRMASMGEMIDSIAHQWRQPLMHINAVLMNMERKQELKNETDPYMQQKMDEVITLTAHMSQTIEDFRSLFHKEKQKSPFDVVEAINYTLNLYKNGLKDVEVHFTHPQKLIFYGYKNETIQVFMILINNATEAFKERNILHKTLSLTLEVKEHTVYVEICDNAGGIDTSYIERIFDPYFTTKDGTGGSGLGLYIAKIVIEHNMNGQISVHNNEEGACFTITLPLLP